MSFFKCVVLGKYSTAGQSWPQVLEWSEFPDKEEQLLTVWTLETSTSFSVKNVDMGS